MGPYLVFYNEHDDEINRKIVDLIYKLDHKFRKLKIFEISWKYQLKYNFASNKQMLNTVKLYAFGEIFIQKLNPDEKEINNLFDQAVKIHNENICSKVENVGKRTINQISKKNFESTKIKEDVIKKYKSVIESKRKQTLKDIIIQPNNIYSHKVENIKYKFPFMIKNDIKANIVHKNVVLNCPSHMELFQRVDKNQILQKPWYDNVEINDLPSEIMFETKIKDIKSHNYINSNENLKTNNNSFANTNSKMTNNHKYSF